MLRVSAPLALFPGLLTLLVGCSAASEDGPSDPGAIITPQPTSAENPMQPAEPATPSSTPSFTLDEGTLRLAPGQQGLFCSQMPVPAEYLNGEYFFTGLDAEVSLGTHHFIMTSSDGSTANEPALCRDTGSGQVTSGNALFQDLAVDPDLSSVFETLTRVAFGGGGGEAMVRFPDGYGKPMPKGFFESSHHVLNATQGPIDIFGRFHVFTATREEIHHPVGVAFANALNIAVPPNSAGSVEATLTVPEGVEIVALISHAHDFLVRFEMFLYEGGAAAAEPVYVSDDWEAPAVQVLDPPVQLGAGDGITFRCTYQNDTPGELRWGVVGGEMCMPFVLYAYPEGSSRGVPPTMSALMNDSAPVVLEVGTGGFGG